MRSQTACVRINRGHVEGTGTSSTATVTYDYYKPPLILNRNYKRIHPHQQLQEDPDVFECCSTKLYQGRYKRTPAQV